MDSFHDVDGRSEIFEDKDGEAMPREQLFNLGCRNGVMRAKDQQGREWLKLPLFSRCFCASAALVVQVDELRCRICFAIVFCIRA